MNKQKISIKYLLRSRSKKRKVMKENKITTKYVSYIDVFEILVSNLQILNDETTADL